MRKDELVSILKKKNSRNYGKARQKYIQGEFIDTSIPLFSIVSHNLRLGVVIRITPKGYWILRGIGNKVELIKDYNGTHIADNFNDIDLEKLSTLYRKFHINNLVETNRVLTNIVNLINI